MDMPGWRGTCAESSDNGEYYRPVPRRSTYLPVVDGQQGCEQTKPQHDGALDRNPEVGILG